MSSSTDGVVFESIEQSKNGNQVELRNLSRSQYLLASVGHCARPPDYSFNELQHHDSLKIPVAFGLGEASAGGANCSLTSLLQRYGVSENFLMAPLTPSWISWLDLPTQGWTVEQRIKATKWWYGPNWLSGEEHKWPTFIDTMNP
jgi:hypothetical protein